jgi:hypothetical protein
VPPHLHALLREIAVSRTITQPPWPTVSLRFCSAVSMLLTLPLSRSPPLSSPSPPHCPSVSLPSSALLSLTAHLSHSLLRYLTASLTLPLSHLHTVSLAVSPANPLAQCPTVSLPNAELLYCPTVSLSNCVCPIAHLLYCLDDPCSQCLTVPLSHGFNA